MGYGDALGDRMKGYENVSQAELIRRMPVIIRVDGRAFHTFTKKINHFNDVSMSVGPFSEKLHGLMTATAQGLVHNIQNAVMAYTQSDEISILIKDWNTLTTDQWFGANLQKMVSISAAMASSYFNYLLPKVFGITECFPPIMPNGLQQIPLFDSRAFNLPKEEVTNYFIWRQQDASRNSVNMLGRYYFSQKEMHGKSVGEVQDMLMGLKFPINWNDLDTWKKRGSCILHNPDSLSSVSPTIVDENIPIFTQNRDYIEQLLLPEANNE